MIKSFRHKGLKRFFETGNISGIQANHARRLKIVLQRLNASESPGDMNLPGFDYHSLKGDLKGYSTVSVNGNWRVIFRFDGCHAVKVDYVDYH